MARILTAGIKGENLQWFIISLYSCNGYMWVATMIVLKRHGDAESHHRRNAPDFANWNLLLCVGRIISARSLFNSSANFFFFLFSSLYAGFIHGFVFATLRLHESGAARILRCVSKNVSTYYLISILLRIKIRRDRCDRSSPSSNEHFSIPDATKIWKKNKYISKISISFISYNNNAGKIRKNW